jgi:hypothetical protein
MSDERCSGCGAPLVWAKHPKTQRLAPITAEPKGNGNILLFRAEPNVVSYAVLTPVLAGMIRDLGVPLRLNHFSDCERAADFKKGGNDAPSADV